ncbi:flagellar hook-length control protein FliK [Photobacterium sp. BZF1]|uniref:flagellar hook-length control protein FliK n=1 Tax=Photobacterium sp. BZF1 TaxID=1904457 RepID=UPI001653778F|nr:flagellar hook-length control protein FliK [Photobacterium sp. BZF1]MBC7001620.1 flagellar hook-length control protein FliK [Photobacterium sp. BZF1]
MVHLVKVLQSGQLVQRLQASIEIGEQPSMPANFVQALTSVSVEQGQEDGMRLAEEQTISPLAVPTVELNISHNGLDSLFFAKEGTEQVAIPQMQQQLGMWLSSNKLGLSSRMSSVLVRLSRDEHQIWQNTQAQLTQGSNETEKVYAQEGQADRFNATPLSAMYFGHSHTNHPTGQLAVQLYSGVNQASPIVGSHQLTEMPVIQIEAMASKGINTGIDIERSLPVEVQKQIYQVIKDKVQIQFDTLSQSARIRFDPPELGKVEMMLRLDGDKLNIQVNASSAITREALIATSERLRSELVSENAALSEVNITYSQQGSYQGQHNSQPFGDEGEGSLLSNDALADNEITTLEYNAYIARV